MSLVILYILCFLIVIAFLTVGYFVGRDSQGYFEELSAFENEKGIISKELANILIKNNNLRNLSVVPLRAKKTNFYSAKYNVIKLSPDILYSGKLINIAITAKCLNQAKKQQNLYISSSLWLITSIVLRFFMIAFIPTVLISAILNISFGLKNIAYTATIVSLICFSLSFIIYFIFYFIDKSSNQEILVDLIHTQIFTENEIKALHVLLLAISKHDFLTFSRLSLKFATLINPAHYAQPENI